MSHQFLRLMLFEVFYSWFQSLNLGKDWIIRV